MSLLGHSFQHNLFLIKVLRSTLQDTRFGTAKLSFGGNFRRSNPFHYALFPKYNSIGRPTIALRSHSFQFIVGEPTHGLSGINFMSSSCIKATTLGNFCQPFSFILCIFFEPSLCGLILLSQLLLHPIGLPFPWQLTICCLWVGFSFPLHPEVRFELFGE